jgi:hypothetical protein
MMGIALVAILSGYRPHSARISKPAPPSLGKSGFLASLIPISWIALFFARSSIIEAV